MTESGETGDQRPTLVADGTGLVGSQFVLEGPAPSTQYVAVFEDDGETGYFYGIDSTLAEQPILDALHVYNVNSVTDRDAPSRFQIVWSGDGMKVALYVNGYPHAAFDFVSRRGYCRTGFPPPSPGFSSESHDWDDAVLRDFE